MGLIWIIAAAFWGFAEATLFFVVPDVLLTLATVRFGWRAGVALAFVALLGALLGGMFMYRWGAMNLGGAIAALDAVPGVSREMINRVREGLDDPLVIGMSLGALTGIPYKIFATSAGIAGIPVTSLLAATIVARLVRWILLIGIAAAIVVAMRRRSMERHALALWAALWGTFYIFYFSVMSG